MLRLVAARVLTDLWADVQQVSAEENAATETHQVADDAFAPFAFTLYVARHRVRY